jgi:protein tyrosine/serine phosphatase
MQESPRAVRLSLSMYVRAVSALVMTAALAAAAAPAPRMDDARAEIDNFGQVNENYFRGGQPDAAGIAALKRLGVRTVINLREDAVREEPFWVRDSGMAYFNIPLTTKRPATAEQTAYFLRLVNDPANLPVYVHCAGGKHRAGEMTALYRITHDLWNADQAYREMQRYKFDTFPFHASLRDYVYRYFDAFTQSLEAKARSTAPSATGAAAAAAAVGTSPAGAARK